MNCHGKAGGKTPGRIQPSGWGGTAKPAQPACEEGTAGSEGALQGFTDAKSDSRTDRRAVRAQPPLPLPRGMVSIRQSLQPCYGMRGFVITLLDVLHMINIPEVLNSGWKERCLHPAPSWKLC